MNVRVVDITEKHLEIKFKGKNISDVLNMTVDEGCDFLKILTLSEENYLHLKK